MRARVIVLPCVALCTHIATHIHCVLTQMTCKCEKPHFCGSLLNKYVMQYASNQGRFQPGAFSARGASSQGRFQPGAPQAGGEASSQGRLHISHGRYMEANLRRLQQGNLKSRLSTLGRLSPGHLQREVRPVMGLSLQGRLP